MKPKFTKSDSIKLLVVRVDLIRTSWEKVT